MSNEYTVIKGTGHDNHNWFIGVDGKLNPYHAYKSAEAAWSAASAKAHAEARKIGGSAWYTITEIWTDQNRDTGSRSCWKVMKD